MDLGFDDLRVEPMPEIEISGENDVVTDFLLPIIDFVIINSSESRMFEVSTMEWVDYYR